MSVSLYNTSNNYSEAVNNIICLYLEYNKYYKLIHIYNNFKIEIINFQSLQSLNNHISTTLKHLRLEKVSESDKNTCLYAGKCVIEISNDKIKLTELNELAELTELIGLKNINKSMTYELNTNYNFKNLKINKNYFEYNDCIIPFSSIQYMKFVDLDFKKLEVHLINKTDVISNKYYNIFELYDIYKNFLDNNSNVLKFL